MRALFQATLTGEDEGAWHIAREALLAAGDVPKLVEGIIARGDPDLGCRALLFYADWLGDNAMPEVLRLSVTYPLVMSGGDWPEMRRSLDDHGVVALF